MPGSSARHRWRAVVVSAVAVAAGLVVVPHADGRAGPSTADARRDLALQAADISFVIDRLVDAGAAPAGLRHPIRPDRIAVAGHSDGAVAAAGLGFNTTARDPRVRAVVTLSGGAFGLDGSWSAEANAPALLAIHGTADTVNPRSASDALFAVAAGPKWLVEVDGDHDQPYTDGPQVLAVRNAAADFLSATMNGRSAAAQRLSFEARQPPLHLVASG